MKRIRARFAALVMFAGLTLGVIPAFSPAVSAQNLGQRSVAGLVVDANSAPLQGATVFLRNTKTKSIRSYTSSANGRFRFAQVTMSDDFDLWAEKDGKKTATKTVSSWDARKEFETELKMK